MRVLVIGYGNPLRQDDGLGWHIAEQLAVRYAHQHDVQVEVCHQLTPELAEPISRADRLLFIDVDIHLTPGALALTPLHPSPAVTQASTHRVDPVWLVSLAERLFGHRPSEVAQLRLGPDGFDHSDALSATGQRLLPEALAQAEVWITR
jgi:hydrogenase maturation protease